MKKIVVGVLATVALGIASIAPEPAAAHNWDNYSTWFCAAHAPTGYSLEHSWPFGMDNGIVIYWCRAGYWATSGVQYWVEWNQNNGTSRQIGGYQACNPGGITWCGSAGH